MAKLFINKDIVKDADKELHYWFTGQDSVSYSDIQDFLNQVPENDNTIDIELYSCGGDCTEGFAIYDALRASGKEISTTVVGTCASMATVLLLAAPIEKRKAYKHAQFLIHNPYFPSGSVTEDLTIPELEKCRESLVNEKNKILDIYVERTGKEKDILDSQMENGEFFGVSRALELGFISSVIPEASASIKPKIMSMSKKELSVSDAFRQLGIAMGVLKPEAVNLTLSTQEGQELEVEREEGDIAVGDKATPDGVFTLEDGRVVTVADGVITDISSPEEGTEALNARIEELEAEIAELKANAKSESDKNILACVEKAGGPEWLDKVTSSNYTPPARAPKASPRKEDPNAFKEILNKRLNSKKK